MLHILIGDIIIYCKKQKKMILELSATEIVACIIRKHIILRNTNDSAVIKITKIQRIAHQLETEMPSLLTYCDRAAIEDCKYEFGESVTIDDSSIKILSIQEIESQVSRFLPDNSICVKIDGIL